MLDLQQRSALAWTTRSVAVRSRDGPQRVAQVYRRLLAPPPRDTAGSDAVEKPTVPRTPCQGEMT